MKIKYNTNNNNGAQAKELDIGSAHEAISRGLAETIGDWMGQCAAWGCTEREQGADIEGDNIVLIERKGE